MSFIPSLRNSAIVSTTMCLGFDACEVAKTAKTWVWHVWGNICSGKIWKPDETKHYIFQLQSYTWCVFLEEIKSLLMCRITSCVAVCSRLIQSHSRCVQNHVLYPIIFAIELGNQDDSKLALRVFPVISHQYFIMAISPLNHHVCWRDIHCSRSVSTTSRASDLIRRK